MRALFRKKFLMQIRDKKTLGVDTLFPILLIIIGLALATISIFKDGDPRDMTPSLYEQDKMYLMQNTNSLTLNEDTITKFMNENYLR